VIQQGKNGSIKKCISIYFKVKISIGFFLIMILILPSVGYSQTEESSTGSSSSEDILTIEQCIEIALKNSYEIAIGRGSLNKAEIDLKDAKAARLPELDLTGGYNLNDTYSRLEWDENHYDLALSASITPYNGARTRINVGKSQALLDSAKENYRLTEITLVLEVINKYYNLFEASELLKLKRESLSQKKKHLEFAEAQFTLGLVPKADILKAGVEVANAEVELLQAEGNLELARAELNDVMGIDLENPTKIKPIAFTKEEPIDFTTCLKEALTNRPEILQQEAHLTINQYNLKLAQKDRLPSFAITGTYNVYADKLTGSRSDSGNWDESTDWAIGIGFSFPLFEGGIRSRALQTATIDLNEAELNYLELKKEINLEVKLAHLNLATAFKKIELTEKQVKSAEVNYNAALGRYKIGIASITEVIDAELALSNSKVNHIQALYEYLLAQAVLKKNMGKFPY
jgi:outer membrane protein